MARDPRAAVDRLRERIETSGEIVDADRELLLAFSDRLDLLAQTYSDHHYEKLLCHGTIVAGQLDGGTLASAVEDRVAGEVIVRWINCEHDNEETNRDYRNALRVIAKRVTDGDEMPGSDCRRCNRSGGQISESTERFSDLPE